MSVIVNFTLFRVNFICHDRSSRNILYILHTPLRLRDFIRSFINFILRYILIIVFLLQKQTWLFLTDNTNVRWLKIFHLYKGFIRKTTHEGLFVKGSARIVEPPRIEYKGFKYRYKIKGDICRCWIARTNRRQHYNDGKCTQFNDNSGININKKVNIMSKYINGPISKSIKRKKLVMLFKQVL
jgi:ribosomal protein L14